MPHREQHLLILGCGYVGAQLARRCLRDGVRVSAVRRSADGVRALRAVGIDAYCAPSPEALPDRLLCRVTHLVDSIPLQRGGDAPQASQPAWVAALMAKMPKLRQVCYLSSSSVYGDAGGAWVDESTPCRPGSPRGRARLAAEAAWCEVAAQHPASIEIFRLAGIYGPQRNLAARLHAGYRVVAWEPPHWSNRIHVADIVAALIAAMRAPRPGRIINLADDYPLPHADYVTRFARMIGAPAPEILTPAEGARQLSAAALDFFRDNKRIANRRLHRELLPVLHFPSFEDAVRAGFQAVEA